MISFVGVPDGVSIWVIAVKGRVELVTDYNEEGLCMAPKVPLGTVRKRLLDAKWTIF